MIKYLLSIILLLAITTNAEKHYGNLKRIHVLSVYDGDTFKVNLPKSYPPIIGDSIDIRVSGENTPELHYADSLAAKRARDSVRAWIGRAGNTVDLLNMGRDKFYRIDADVRFKMGGKYISLADTLIKAGMAAPYFGGKK